MYILLQETLRYLSFWSVEYCAGSTPVKEVGPPSFPKSREVRLVSTEY